MKGLYLSASSIDNLCRFLQIMQTFEDNADYSTVSEPYKFDEFSYDRKNFEIKLRYQLLYLKFKHHSKRSTLNTSKLDQPIISQDLQK